MHENVHPAHVLDEVVARARVPREHERVTVIIEAKAERLTCEIQKLACLHVDGHMGHFERRDFEAIVVVDDARRDIPRFDVDAFARDPHEKTILDIPIVGFPKMAQHLRRPDRALHHERHPTAKKPSGEPEVGKPKRVVEMKMRDQNVVDTGQELKGANLHDALAKSPARVDEHALVARLHEDARAVALE